MDRQENDSAREAAPGDSLNPDDTHPIPRRFLWLKRLLILSALFVACLLLVRLWWGYEAHRRLQAEIKRYQSAGQLVYAHEFDAELDAVEDELNAAVLLEKAIAGITPMTELGVHFETLLDDPEAVEKEISAATELMQLNASVLGLARQARDRPQVAWSQRLQKLPWFITGPGSGQRLLAKFLWLAAAYYFQTGDHAEGVETLHDYVAFNDAIEAHPTVISSLVAWACDNLAFSLVEDFGADLEILDRESTDTGELKAARRERVEELIRRLLDEEPSRRSLIRTFYGDRAFNLELLDAFDEVGWAVLQGMGSQPPPLLERGVNWLQRPIVVLETVRSVKLASLTAEAATEENWPMAALHFPEQAEDRSFLRTLTRPLTDTLFGSTYQSARTIIQVFFKYSVRRRMAGTALAIRLYVIDNGHRPEKLSALVPAYLPELPIDPFSTQMGSIRYRLEVARPVLYSVGYDGRDDEGSLVLQSDGHVDHERSDILLYLDGQPRDDDPGDSSSLPETPENDNNAQDAEREPDENQGSETQPQARDADRKQDRPAL